MFLELIIKSETVELVELPITKHDHPTISHRMSVVNDYRDYLKRKYSMDMMLTKDWQINLIAQSQLNYIHADDVAEGYPLIK